MGSATRSRSHRDTGPVSSVSKQLVKAKRTVPATGSLFLCPFQQENAFLSFHPELGGPSTQSLCTTAFHLLITPPSRALSLLSGEGMAYGAVLPGAQRPPGLCLADGGLEGLGVAIPVQEGRAVAAQPVTCSLWTHPRGGAHVHTSCAPSSGVIGPPKETVSSPVILRVGARIFCRTKDFLQPVKATSSQAKGTGGHRAEPSFHFLSIPSIQTATQQRRQLLPSRPVPGFIFLHARGPRSREEASQRL